MKSSVTKTNPGRPLQPSWDLVGPSWHLLIEHIDQVIFLFVLPSLVLLLGSFLLGDTTGLHRLSDLSHRQRLGVEVMAAGLLWSLFNYAPSLYFRLQVAGGKTVNLRSCYRRGLPFFWRLAGLYLLLGVLLVAGFLLFVLPGLVLLVVFINRYYLAEYFLMDRKLGIRQALVKSHQDTAPFVRSIWGTIGVQISFGLFAAVLGAIGRLGAIPAAFIQLVCVFLPALRYWEIRHVYHHAKAR